ncbi:MAG: TIGR03826 family flagellar region protein [bacterium]
MSMNLANCPRCGNIFNRAGGHRYCPACEAEDEKKFQLVRDFLDEHPKANAIEIAEATGVEESKIMEFLREGRLIAVSDSPLAYPCEECGAPITSGRFCSKCADAFKKDISRGLGKAAKQAREEGRKADAKSRMYVVEHLKRRNK